MPYLKNATCVTERGAAEDMFTSVVSSANSSVDSGSRWICLLTWLSLFSSCFLFPPAAKYPQKTKEELMLWLSPYLSWRVWWTSGKVDWLQISRLKFKNCSTREVFWVSGENPKARSPPFSSSVLVSTVHAVSDCRETSFNPSWLIVVLSSICFIFYFRLTRQCLQIFEFRASVKSTSGNLALVENENPECSKPRTFDRSAPNLKDDTSRWQFCSFPITNKLDKLDKQNIKPP